MIIAAAGSVVWPAIILVVYILMMVGVAFFCRKKSATLDDFFLAGRGLGGWMSAFAYGTTYFSSVIFIGYAGQFGWSMGTAAVWLGIGNAVIGSFVAWRLLASRTRVMTHMLGTKTMPEFFEKRYNSRGLRLFAAIIIFVFLIPYSASVYQGLGYLFEMIFNIDFIWCIIIMATLTALYLFFGGYFATALSDFIQGIIMLIGVIVMVFCLLARPEVNWSEGLSKLTADGFGFIPSAVGANGATGWNSPLFNCIILTLLTSFGILGLPQSVHKFYAVKNKRSVKQAMTVSTVFCAVIGIGAYFVGSLGRLFLSEMPAGGVDAIVPEMLKIALHPALLGIIMVLVLSASMSTLASLSLSGASSVAVDAYKGFIRPDADDKKVNILLKSLCMVFILISVLLAVFKVEAIVTLMSLSWGTLAGCFLGPYVFGLYSKRANKIGAWASLIAGLAVTFILVFVFGAISPAGEEKTFVTIFKGGVARSPFIGVIAMAVSVIITPLASLCTRKKPSVETVELLDAVKEGIKDF